MVKTIFLKTKSLTLWIDEYPTLDYNFTNVLSKTLDLSNKQIKAAKKLCIELSYIRDASNYGLLGLEYIPNDNSLLQIDIYYNSKNTNKYNNQKHLFGYETKYC